MPPPQGPARRPNNLPPIYYAGSGGEPEDNMDYRSPYEQQFDAQRPKTALGGSFVPGLTPDASSSYGGSQQQDMPLGDIYKQSMDDAQGMYPQEPMSFGQSVGAGIVGQRPVVAHDALANFVQGVAGGISGGTVAKARIEERRKALLGQAASSLASRRWEMQRQLQEEDKRAKTQADTESRRQQFELGKEGRANAEYDRRYQMGLSNPKPTAAMQNSKAGIKTGAAAGPNAVSNDDIHLVAGQMVRGELPVDAATGNKPTQYTIRLMAEGNRIDPTFNPAKAQLDQRAARQFYQTMNQSNQVRFRQITMNAGETVKQTTELLQQLYDKIPQQQIGAFSRANLTAVKNGLYGPEAAGLAGQLLLHIGALQTELPNVYSGGFAPQQEQIKEVRGSLDLGLPIKVLEGGLKGANRAINIRLGVFNETGTYSPSNPYQPGQTPTQINTGGTTPIPVGNQGAAEEWVKVNGKWVKK